LGNLHNRMSNENTEIMVRSRDQNPSGKIGEVSPAAYTHGKAARSNKN